MADLIVTSATPRERARRQGNATLERALRRELMTGRLTKRETAHVLATLATLRAAARGVAR